MTEMNEANLEVKIDYFIHYELGVCRLPVAPSHVVVKTDGSVVPAIDSSP